MSRPNEPAQPDPLAYLLTWTTYGTWLPGDQRGWTKRMAGAQRPDEAMLRDATRKLREAACVLDLQQRQLVESTIREHSRIRDWTLFAVNCRTNHVHIVVFATIHPATIREQFKTWCTRRLKEFDKSLRDESSVRLNWWTEGGSCRYLNDESSLEAAVVYVRDAQDLPRG